MSGVVSQIIGPVVDVEFPEDEIPGIYNALELQKSGGTEKIVAEVQYLIGENKARAICMTSTDGLKRGDEVIDLKAPISVPVGKKVLGRIFNVLGEPVDECGPTGNTESLPIHRPAPEFVDLETQPSIFVTGIAYHLGIVITILESCFMIKYMAVKYSKIFLYSARGWHHLTGNGRTMAWSVKLH